VNFIYLTLIIKEIEAVFSSFFDFLRIPGIAPSKRRPDDPVSTHGTQAKTRHSQPALRPLPRLSTRSCEKSRPLPFDSDLLVPTPLAPIPADALVVSGGRGRSLDFNEAVKHLPARFRL
jgi:hypothetical protein